LFLLQDQGAKGLLESVFLQQNDRFASGIRLPASSQAQSTLRCRNKNFWDVVRTNCIVSTERGYRVSFSLEEGFQMSDNLQETIRESAKAPAKASGDAGSFEQHKLTEQIAADKYLASKAAASQSKRDLRFNKLVPPGAD
jgi:hypothetical protein